MLIMMPVVILVEQVKSLSTKEGCPRDIDALEIYKCLSWWIF